MAATLTEEDIEKLFSGAPQFFARSEGHFTGAPHPSAAFPFDEELEIRDLTDYTQIEDRAWSGATVWPHLTKNVGRDASQGRRPSHETRKAHFHIKCKERPNMLSMQGIEKGTMGYQAAMELSVSDSLEEEQFGFDSVGSKAKVVVEARAKMMSGQGWLHRLPEPDILDRLKRNGEIYRCNDMRKRKSEDTFHELFHNFMRPATFVIDKTDPHSLTNQINAIVKCLATANVWIDLSRVEWRLRLGQVLWGERDGDEIEDPTHIHDALHSRERVEEKYWLLLQILLATELLVRLDAVTDGEEYGGESFRATDVAYFERLATSTVKWSLLLARSWLENIEVVGREAAAAAATAISEKATPPLHHSGWLASISSKMALQHHLELPNRLSFQKHRYLIKGRNAERQLDGLMHFARKLSWPGIGGNTSARISETAQFAAERSTSPVSTPMSTPGKEKETSYFGAWDVTAHRDQKSSEQRIQVQRRRLAAALHVSGWLTKSYVFGLILPGESLPHFLMATLLESDSEALARVGSFANLSSGFVYSDKSFWSTACIVGRVLAAGKGAADCMGWISIDLVPEGFNDGWVDIDAADVPDDVAQLGKKARLWGKKKIERESYILGDADESAVSPADFIIPHENTYTTPPLPFSVEFKSLQLSAPEATVEATPLSEFVQPAEKGSNDSPQMPSYPAQLHFASTIDYGSVEQNKFSLAYDINIVTAHPCSPSQRVRVLKSPSSPTIQQIDLSGNENAKQNYRPAHRIGHPLHKYFKYTVIHISELLQKQGMSLGALLGPADTDTTSRPSKLTGNHVLVIDCITNVAEVPQSPSLERHDTPLSPSTGRRDSFPLGPAKMHLESRRRQFGSDVEMMVRAVCAEKGWNAIISRRRRGCLACAIREAGALGWRVVIRVA